MMGLQLGHRGLHGKRHLLSGGGEHGALLEVTQHHLEIHRVAA